MPSRTSRRRRSRSGSTSSTTSLLSAQEVTLLSSSLFGRTCLSDTPTSRRKARSPSRSSARRRSRIRRSTSGSSLREHHPRPVLHPASSFGRSRADLSRVRTRGTRSVEDGVTLSRLGIRTSAPCSTGLSRQTTITSPSRFSPAESCSRRSSTSVGLPRKRQGRPSSSSCKGVIHRDIKAENFLYRKEDSAIDDFQLIDFGISKILTDEDSEADPKTQNEVSGTPGYAAPEVFLRTGYGKNADVFSVGVVGYAMLCGSSPWDAREPWDLVQETVRMREVNFQNRRFDKVSEQAKDFIRLLMTPSPELRPSSAQARQDPWLACPCPPPSQPPTRPSSPNPEDAPGPASHPPDPYHPIEILARQDTLRPGDESVLYRQITAHGTLPAPVSPV